MKRLFLITMAALAATPAAFAMPPRPGLGLKDPTAGLPNIKCPNPHAFAIVQGKDGERVAVGVLANGTKRYPVLLIDYSDRGWRIAKTKYDSLLFISNGVPSGSLRDYYKEISYGKDTVTGNSYGWFNSGNIQYYYGRGNYGLQSLYPNNTGGLVMRALQLADASVDFSQFSRTGNLLDLLIVVHAGPGAEGGPDGNNDGMPDSTNWIWSHNATLGGWGVAQANRTFDGVVVDAYTIQPEISALDPTYVTKQIEIGVFAHELGHALGLPDLYDTDPNATASNGLGCWSLMAAGSWGGDYNHPQYPAHPDAWCKRFLGWATARNVGVNNRDSLAQVERNPQLLTLWKNGSPGSQYFLIENRQKTGFDTLLFDAGLLVYHVDEDTVAKYLATNQINWRQHGVYGVALEEADHAAHLWDGANNGDAADAFAAGNNFAPPYSNDNSGLITNVQIGNISASGPVMWADFVVGSDFNISLLQNPAFTYSLGISLVANYRLLTPNNLDTANLTVDYDLPLRLNFNHPSSRTFQASYVLQKAGNYKIRIAAKDSDSVAVYRTGERSFTVSAAKAAGGSVSALNGAVRLVFPPGAVPHNEFWVICQHDAANPGAIAASPAFQIGPDGRTLSAAAELTLRYDPAALVGRDPAQLGIWRLANGQWQYLGGRLDAAARSVSAPINTAGVYQLCWSGTHPVIAPAAAALPLSANPSPFARTTTISYQLPAPGRVILKIYNIAGQLVRTIRDGHQDAGAQAAVWDGRGDRNEELPSGIYHYRLRIGERSLTGRVVKVQ
ncbi:MAG: M6 family metalloprotease domain-containing protein [Candidatus Edwardsbacteria bacterium]|nr:M6 family metalloprotease domain-containing protein [Candidatus Edwardsbacteria bacterium]